MSAAIERALAAVLENGTCAIGQLAIRCTNDQFILTHRDDADIRGLEIFRAAEDVIALAKFDDAGNYRPLKTAPNLRHGWQLQLRDLAAAAQALEYFYPARLAVLVQWQREQLGTTPLRTTLDRQSGMYRVAAKISDAQLDEVVGGFCKSEGGCLRTILWKRDAAGGVPSIKLPPQKYDPAFDQTGRGARSVPLLCQEACNLLVNECRKAVKGA
jgi:sirohydrochlorin cobaltochelatase